MYRLAVPAYCPSLQRTPAWVLPRKELMPRFAVPAAQHGNRLSLWLQRQAAFWRNELLIGTALVGNRQKLLGAVSLCLSLWSFVFTRLSIVYTF